MRISGIGYLIKQGWRSMGANKLMTFASIGVLTACLFITGIAALLSVNVNNYVNYLSSQNHVEIYLNDGVTDEMITSLQSQVQNIENVSECEYVSKAQAVEEMKLLMGEDADLLAPYEGEGNEQNPLPASFRAKIHDLEFLGETVAEIEEITSGYVYRISVPEDLSQILLSIQDIVLYVGWGLVAVLGVVSVVIISNTIRLTVFARRKEINIMKFVGATNTFIRLPFFIEGMTVGAIAGVISTGIVCGGYYALLNSAVTKDTVLLSAIAEHLLPLEEVFPYISIGFLAFGVLIGSIGCTASIKKHLKV